MPALRAGLFRGYLDSENRKRVVNGNTAWKGVKPTSPAGPGTRPKTGYRDWFRFPASGHDRRWEE